MADTTQALDYCPRCQRYSSNIAIHDCRHTFTIAAEEAYRSGDHAKVTEIVENARAQGVELLGNAWRGDTTNG